MGPRTRGAGLTADGVNISLPIYGREEGDDAYKPWPHVDQSPMKTHLHCIQGLMNLLPNGPDDGGLMVGR